MIADIELSIHVPTEDGTAECGRVTGDNPFGMTIIKMALEAEGLTVITVKNELREPEQQYPFVAPCGDCEWCLIGEEVECLEPRMIHAPLSLVRS